MLWTTDVFSSFELIHSSSNYNLKNNRIKKKTYWKSFLHYLVMSSFFYNEKKIILNSSEFKNLKKEPKLARELAGQNYLDYSYRTNFSHVECDMLTPPALYPARIYGNPKFINFPPLIFLPKRSIDRHISLLFCSIS